MPILTLPLHQVCFYLAWHSTAKQWNDGQDFLRTLTDQQWKAEWAWHMQPATRIATTDRQLVVVCGHCRRYYGTIAGGHIRIGCAHCQNKMPDLQQRLATLAWLLSWPELELQQTFLDWLSHNASARKHE